MTYNEEQVLKKRRIFLLFQRTVVHSENTICAFFLVRYIEGRPWWPIQSPSKGRKMKAERFDQV